MAGELDELLENVTSAAERQALYKQIATNLRSPSEVRCDQQGRLSRGVHELLARGDHVVPAAIPFLLIDKAHLALRVSNAILLATLFITGYWWSRYTLGKPWRVGLSLLIGGVVLVVVAIALGG